MSDETINVRKSGVYKKQDFDSYVLWKSLPSILRGQPRQMLEKFGIDDEVAINYIRYNRLGDIINDHNIEFPTK